MRRILNVSGLLAVLSLLSRILIHLVSHNYNLSAEANGLSGVLHLTRGEPLYPDLTRLPFYVYLYCPLHALFSAAVLKGLHIVSLYPQVVLVRFLSLLSYLLFLFLFWKFVVLPRQIRASAFLLSVLLATSKFADYLTTSRNDMFSMIFEVAAICLMLEWIRKKREVFFAGLIIACALSLFARQTGVAALGASLLWLGWQRQWLRGVYLAFGVAFLTASWIFVFQRLTQGTMFDHVILANVRGFKPFDRTLIDPSFIIFCLSYVAFGYFTACFCVELGPAGRRLF